MKPITFLEQNTTFVKDRPKNHPLPVLRERNGDVTTCWQLSDDEVQEIIESRVIYIHQETRLERYQNSFPTVHKPWETSSCDECQREVVFDSLAIHVLDEKLDLDEYNERYFCPECSPLSKLKLAE